MAPRPALNWYCRIASNGTNLGRVGDVTRVRELLDEIHERFAAAPLSYGQGTDNPWDEAVALVLQVTGLPDTEASLDVHMCEGEVAEIRLLAERRVVERQPLAYLLGRVPYCGETFLVSKGIVVPRSPIGPLLCGGPSPWVEAPDRILDLCCGSGCLGIIAAKCFPNARVVLADIDPLAVATARRNIVAHGLEGRAEVLCSDLFADIPVSGNAGDPRNGHERAGGAAGAEAQTSAPERGSMGVPTVVPKEVEAAAVSVPEAVGVPEAPEAVGVPKIGVPKIAGAYNLILCNPPYVDAAAMASLPAEFAHEPATGLAGGANGLAIMNRVLADVSRYLTHDGVLVGEVGDAAARLEAQWPNLPFFWPDLPEGGAGVFLLHAADTC